MLSSVCARVASLGRTLARYGSALCSHRLAVDSADVRRMEDCKRELAAVLGEEKLAGASALIFANKRDIQGAMDVESMVDALGLRQLENRHWKIVGCSAVNGEGLLDGFDWLVDDVASRIYLYD